VVQRFPEAGDYYLRIYGSGDSGSETAGYRLIAGAMPHVDLALPSGDARGTNVDLALPGVNLEGVKEVTFGPGLAQGRLVKTAFGRAHVPLSIPPDAPLGQNILHIGRATLPFPFVISGVPEITVQPGAARSRLNPARVLLGTVVNGLIDDPRSADYFAICIDGPEDIVLSVESMNLGFLLDPLVVVSDSTGKRIAWQDEPTTNTGKEPANLDPHLAFRLPAAGGYTIAIRGSQFRGDLAYLYRLKIKKAEPDFSLRVVGAHMTLYWGRENTVTVRVRRLEGWNSPVEIWAEGLPPGVTAPRKIAEPKNTPHTGTCGEIHYPDRTSVAVPITVAQDALLDVSQIVYNARGTYRNRTVVREARVRYWKSRIRIPGDAEDSALFATVAELPGAVFQTPERAPPGRTDVILTRLDDSTGDLVIDGDGVDPVSVSHGVTRVGIRFAKPGEIVLNGRVNGRLVGRSQPVRVESPK
jgi:hypothetical protein